MLRELQEARTASIARESALRLDIDRLQTLMTSRVFQTPPSLPDTPPVAEQPAGSPLNHDSEHESSMDLETPLIGTISFPAPFEEIPETPPYIVLTEDIPEGHNPEPSMSPYRPLDLLSSPPGSPPSRNSASPTLFPYPSPITIDPGAVLPPVTSAKEDHLRRLERQLETAKIDLEAKDTELRVLRQTMIELRAQVANITDDSGNIPA